MRKRKDPKTYNLLMGFAEQIALIGILWAILYANPTATANILAGLGFTLPYFPFAFSVFIICFLVGFYVNIIGALKENINNSKKRNFKR